MTDWQGRTTTYEYDENSMLIKTNRPDGTVETRDYDKAGQLTAIVDQKDNTIINSYYYTYDETGNITAVTGEPPQSVSGNSVSGNAIAEADQSETTESTDNNSSQNRTAQDLSNINDAVMEYDQNNRLIKYNGEEVKYDKDGNMTYGPLNGEMADFTYDCRNRLIRTVTKSGQTTEYCYDAENNRTGIIKNAGTKEETRTSYVIDSSSGDLTQVIKSVETDKNGNEKILYYYYGDNRLIAQEEYKQSNNTEKESDAKVQLKAVADTYLTYHFNNVGSTTAVTDQNGNIKYRYDYSAYGDLIEGEYGQIAFLFNGQYGVMSDDNGLYYMRARYYNIDIKRFINQDVITGSIDSSPSLNRYAYVEGNPVSYLDPFGLEAVDTSKFHDLAVVGGIALSVLSTAILFSSGGTDFPVAMALLDLATQILAINDFMLYLYDLVYADSNEERIAAAIGIFNCVVSYVLGKILGCSNVNQIMETEAGKTILQLEYTVVNFFAGKIGEIIEGFKESIKAIKYLYGGENDN